MKRTARHEIRKALEACSGTIAKEHALIDAITATVGSACLESLLKNGNVESAGSDAPVSVAPLIGEVDTSGSITSFTGDMVTPYALRQTLGVKPGSTGAGIGVAIIDSGIAPVAGLADRITAFYDFTGGDVVATAPRDDYGHGTHVAGLIGANDPNYLGVAPGVRFIGLKVLDATGGGRTSDVIRALEYAVANRGRLGIRIVNLSLGHPILAPAADDPLVQAVESAVRAGLVVTVSAGNRGTNPETGRIGYAGIGSPGNAPSAITSGAQDTKETLTRIDDSIAPYSSRGPSWYDGLAKPDIVAPGHKLVSLASPGSFLYSNYAKFRVVVNGRSYLRLSGTSMASAVTAGVVATILEAHRLYAAGAAVPITPAAVKALLQYTAVTLYDIDATPFDVLTQGTGSLNAEGATRVGAALGWLAAASVNPFLSRFDPKPFLLGSYLTPTSVIASQSLPWSTRLIWGPDVVRASNLVWGSNIVWSDNIVWGENIVWSESIWGNNIVWSENIVWAENIVWSENVVWGENIVWSENIVWGENVVWGENIVWAENIVWSENILWTDPPRRRTRERIGLLSLVAAADAIRAR